MPKHASDLDALRRGDLSGARALRLPGLTELPREVFGLADTLEVLDIGGGALTALPDDMGRLRRLRILFASNNRFERLPPALGDCESLAQIGFRAAGLREIPAESLPPSLRWLTLTDNRIERLPDALAQRPQLQKLMLAGNRLSALPRGLAEAPALELIRLAANRFETLPAWLGDIPTLAWISWNGNPAERALPAARAAAAPWAEIELGARLGGGASGDVFRATWRGRSVAVKLFRGAMTSDGAPESEMAASLSAGGHPHLVSALGRVVGHPEGRAGLMTPLLPEHWRALAGPPDFTSCSRDVYDEALRLEPAAALRLARGIATAAAHLHACGVLHGDLYAHNIVWDGRDGEAALADFGAASALPEGDERWTRVEVRAFGVLLEELAALSDAEPLRALARACLQPHGRPSMADVAQELSRRL
ncbi:MULTISPECIES: leucine-rich repeat-containing protein kinase family protein [Methylosinus]|uniref:Protein kinase n=1 Tax=Methylosinus trichosporium (strain ATCC 35070 / NCIMB 11131 / UNIQEM 75 / OB3b) TaxID=595536 RepID=A0A2D2D4S9_METT3|nr:MULTISPECIES: leucine-rich repeat-containing protein kinase family protein [Methylosinus]ATQ69992.1 protein kinase [Methylosinus trichosporium OB3b]OBS50362.1 protein kinase [Methylosinus sp. 3S-1]